MSRVRPVWFLCCALALFACGDSRETGVASAEDVTPTENAAEMFDSSGPGADASALDATQPEPSEPRGLDGGGTSDGFEPEHQGGDLSVGAVPETEVSFAPYFQKHAEVFGLNIFATEAVSDEDVLHAAAVLAQYLDNDEDGLADDPAVLAALQGAPGGPASMVMFATEWEIESSGIFDSNLGSRALQDLYATETHPRGSSASTGFDATLEEVLHLVTHHGWAAAYPEDFGEQPGSTLSDAMDVARGGHFTTLPEAYPEAAWYHYDDETCSYECMATEYLYWALTSLLGGQMYPGRCEEIAHEWELCTPESVVSQDAAITALLQDSGYALPTVLPDGIYEPAP